MGQNTPRLAANSLQKLTLVTAGWLLLLTFVGAVGQVINGGGGCPEWFLCNHQLTPPSSISDGLNLILFVGASLAASLSIVTAVVGQRSTHSVRTPLLSHLTLWSVMSAFVYLLSTLGVIGLQSTLIRVAYLASTLVYLGLTLFLATVVHAPEAYLYKAGHFNQAQKNYVKLLLWTGAALIFLTLNGALVTERNAATACPDWPLCRGEFLPFAADLNLFVNLFHRFSVIIVAIIIAAVILRTCRLYSRQPLLIRQVSILGFLFLAQIGVGAWSVVMPNISRVTLNATHLTVTIAIWGALVVLAATYYLLAHTLPITTSQPETPQLTVRQKAGVYFKLTKPWIMVLLLITTGGAMFIANKGLPPLSLILVTMVGGALAAGGASVLNSYVDSDIDQLMSRTSRRATAIGLVTPQETLIFGLILSTLSFFVYALFVNTLSAVLSTLGILYYVFFYTLYLKRSTIHNIIIGGAAGAIPPLVGWTAITNTLDLGAMYLFAIIFFWTPPHTWALALLVKKDYAQARVPMLPVVVGEKETTYQIFLYTILLVTLTFLPVTFNMLSLIYLLAAIALGIPFLYLAWKLWREYNKSVSKRLYKFSQLYLALLFLVMAIDRSFFVP